MRIVALAIVAAAIVAVPAHADEPAPETRWYGYQTFLSDAASTALFMLGPQGTILCCTDRPGLMVLGAAGYLLGAPLVHLIGHDQPGTALKSLGLRVALPIGGAIAGALIGGIADSGTTHSQDWDGPPGWFIGGAVGFVLGIPLAMIIDWSVLSREPVEQPRFSVAPIYQPTTHARGLALQLRF
jgi:hypothetical protein